MRVNWVQAIKVRHLIFALPMLKVEFCFIMNNHRSLREMLLKYQSAIALLITREPFHFGLSDWYNLTLKRKNKRMYMYFSPYQVPQLTELQYASSFCFLNLHNPSVKWRPVQSFVIEIGLLKSITIFGMFSIFLWKTALIVFWSHYCNKYWPSWKSMTRQCNVYGEGPCRYRFLLTNLIGFQFWSGKVFR